MELIVLKATVVLILAVLFLNACSSLRRGAPRLGGRVESYRRR